MAGKKKGNKKKGNQNAKRNPVNNNNNPLPNQEDTPAVDPAAEAAVESGENGADAVCPTSQV